MEIFLSKLISGIALGSIYALLATGVNLLLLVGGVFQFAYPHLVVLAMYVLWMVLGATGDNLALAIPVTILSGIGLSLATEPIFRPLSQRGTLVASFIAAIGIATILSDLMSREINYGRAVPFPAFAPMKESLIGSTIVSLSMGQRATILGSVAVVVGLFYLLYRTNLGRAFRAMDRRRESCALAGQEDSRPRSQP